VASRQDVTLLCAACLLEPSCCNALNNFSMSLTPHLKYMKGPPPIWRDNQGENRKFILSGAKRQGESNYLLRSLGTACFAFWGFNQK
jgi:hypothetical protein